MSADANLELSYELTQDIWVRTTMRTQRRLRWGVDLAWVGMAAVAVVAGLSGATFAAGLLAVCCAFLLFVRSSITRRAHRAALLERGDLPYRARIDIEDVLRFHLPGRVSEIDWAAVTRVEEHAGDIDLYADKMRLGTIPTEALPDRLAALAAIDAHRAHPSALGSMPSGDIEGRFVHTVEHDILAEHHRAVAGKGRNLSISALGLSYWAVIVGGALSTAAVRWDLPVWTRAVAWLLAFLLVFGIMKSSAPMKRLEAKIWPPPAAPVQFALSDTHIFWRNLWTTHALPWSAVKSVESYPNIVLLQTTEFAILLPAEAFEDFGRVVAYANDHFTPEAEPPTPHIPVAAPDASDPFAPPQDAGEAPARLITTSTWFWLLIFAIGVALAWVR